MKTKRLVKGDLDVLNRLNELDRIMSTKVPKDFLDEIANGALKTAQDTILQADHTQKYGDTLANQVSVVREGENKIAVFAPSNRLDLEMRNQMYFLEYGAGIQSEKFRYKTNKIWFYPSLSYDKSPLVDEDKIGSMITQSKSGGKTEISAHFERKGKFVGFTNISKPVGYMKEARRYIQKNARGQLKEAVARFVLGNQSLRKLIKKK